MIVGNSSLFPFFLVFLTLLRDFSVTNFVDARFSPLSDDEQLLANEKINQAIERAQETLSVIYNRYQLNEKIGQALFFISQNLDESSYNLVKYQFARKITSNKHEQYLLVFGGSSVTAGHDNQYNQSYPEVVGRKIRPILEVFDIPTIVHNVAQGANGCFPSNYCYESMGGFNPDLVGWEQSFNCGHSQDMFETAPRFALWSSNPGMAYYSQSGSVNPGKKCEISKIQPPRCREEWRMADENLTPWKPTKNDVIHWREELFRSYKAIGSTAARFAGAAFDYKKQGAPIAVSGSAVWETRDDSFCAGTNIPPKKCNVGDIFESCDLLKFVSKECFLYGSASGNGAGWHPTIATHLYRGELIAWLLTISLLDALYMIQEDIAAGIPSKAALYAKYTKSYEGLYTLKGMPKPVYCGGPKRCETKPKCFTDYHPHYASNMSLAEILVGTTNWVNTLPDLAHSTLPDVEHIEARPGYTATDGPRSGELHVKITIGDYKNIIVCAYHAANFFAATEFQVELNVSEERLKNYTPGTDRKKWLHVVNVDGCSELSNFPSGTHVVSLESKVNEYKSQAGISHVITWD